MGTADKKSLYCRRCKISGHSYEACRRRRRSTRSPSQSGYSTRLPSASPTTTSSAESEHEEKKKKKRKERGGKQRRSREEKKSKNDLRHKRASSQTTSASRSRSNSRSRGKAGRTPKTKRKIRDTINIIQEDSFSDSESRMRATRMAELSQGQNTSSQLKITVDTGSKYNILDEAEAATRGWKVDKLTEWEEPSLRYADGRKMPIAGKTSLWIRLDKEQNKRKVELFVTPNLRSKMIIGLIDLKRLGWTTPQWPLDIERWQSLFQSPPTDDESEDDVINNINDDDAQGEEVTMEKADKEEGHEEEEDEEEQRGTIDITDFEDLKTYKDIPGFKNFPTWLQEMIKEFKTVFTNQLSKHSIMNVKPATFTLKKNVEIPNNNLTAHFPPANLRDSADKLLDKLEQGGLIKKAPRVCKYKSKAFFKAKKNNEARLLVDYKASQVG